MSILDNPGLNPNDFRLDSNDDDYLNDLPDPSRILDDPRVRNDIRAHYESMGETFDSDYDMLEEFWKDRFWSNTNSLAMAGDLAKAYTAEGEDAMRRARLQRVYTMLPNFYADGGATDRFGGASTTTTIAGSLLADPLNLIGGMGAAKTAGLAAAKGASRGAATWAGVKTAAKTELLPNAAVGGVYSAGTQARDMSLGLQDEFDYGQLAKDAALEGVLGSAAGSLIGTVTAQRGISVGRKQADQLAQQGVTPELLQALPDEQLHAVFENMKEKGVDSVVPDLLAHQQALIDDGTISPAERSTDDIPPPGSPEAQQWAQSSDYLPENAERPAVQRRGQQAAEEPVDLDPPDDGGDDGGNSLAELRAYVAQAPDDDEAAALLQQVEAADRSLTEADQIAKQIEAMAEGEQKAALLQQFTVARAGLSAGREEALRVGMVDPLAEPATQFQALRAELDAANKPEGDNAPQTGEGETPIEAEAPVNDFAEGGALVEYAPIAEQYGETVARRFANHPEDLPAPSILQAKQPLRQLRKLARLEGLDTRTGIKADQLRKALELPNETIQAWNANRALLDDAIKAKGAEVSPEDRRDVVSTLLRGEGFEEDDLNILAAVSKDEDDLDFLKSLPANTPIEMTLPNGAKLSGTYEEIVRRMIERKSKKVDSGLPKRGQGIVSSGRKTGSADGRTMLRSEAAPKPGRYGYEAARELSKTGKYLDAAGNVRQTSVTNDVVEIPSDPRERGEFISKHNLQHHRQAIKEGKITHANTRTGLTYRTKQAALDAVVTPDDAPPFAFKQEGGKGSHSYKVADASSKKDQHLKRGEIGYVDPANGKVYRHYENLIQAKYGKVSNEPAHAPGEAPAAKKSEAPAKASEAKPQAPVATYEDIIERLLAAQEAGVKGKDDLLAVLNGAKKEAAQVDAPAPTAHPNALSAGNFHQPGAGRVPAIYITEGQFAGSYRVASAKQLGEFSGDALAAKLAGKVAPGQYKMGTVDASVPRFQTKKVSASFTADDGTAAAPLPSTAKGQAIEKVVAAARKKEMAPPLTLEEAGEIQLRYGDLTPAQQRGIKRLFPFETIDGNTPVSLESVNSAIGRLHSADWFQIMRLDGAPGLDINNLGKTDLASVDLSRSGIDIPSLIEEITELEALLAEHAPQGIRKPTQERRAAIDSLQTVLAGHTPEDIEAARVFLERLNLPDEGSAPLMRRDKFTGSNGYYQRGENVVAVGEVAGEVRPAVSTLYHEVGHWAYDNLLTHADRVEFWRIIDKNFVTDKGFRNQAAIDKAVPQASIGSNNGASSPQELFANQFDLYVHKVMSGEKLAAHEQTFWQRLVRYIKALFDVYASGEAVHPDLEPLFAKILPQESLVKGVDIDKVPSFPNIKAAPEPKTEWGQRLRANWDELNMVRGDIMDVSDLSPAKLSQVVDFLTLVGTNKKLKGQKKEQAWAPFKAIGPEIRAARNQLVAYMRMLDGKSLSTPVGDGDSTLGDYVGAAWDDMAEMGEIPSGYQIEAFGGGELDEVMQKVEDFLFLGEANFLNKGEKLPSLKSTLDKMERELASWYFGNEGVLIGKTVTMPPMGKNGALRKQFTQDIPWMELYKRTQAKENGIVIGQVQLVRRFNRSHAERKAAVVKGSGKSPKTMTEAELRDGINKHLGTSVSQSLAEELLKKMKAAPAAPKANVTIPDAVKTARAEDHATMLRKAIRENDTAMIDAIEAEHYRRWEKRALKKLQGVTLKDAQVSGALRRERDEWAGDQIEDGIPPSAPAIVREALGAITHRDPETQIAARTIAYRLSSLDNVDPKQPHFLSAAQVSRLTASPVAPSSERSLPNLQGDGFNKLRKDVRQIATAINRGDEAPVQSMRKLAAIVSRTRAFNDADRNTILAAYDQASDAIKRRIEQDHGNLSQQQQAERWFAEGWTDFASEQVALDDISNTRARGDDFDPQTRSQLSSLHEKLTDAVAYVLNGNIGRQDVKQKFRKLSHYGDMFEPAARADTRSALGQRHTLDKGSATSYVADTLRAMPIERRRAVKAFVGGGMGENANGQPVVVYHGTPFGHKLDKGDNPIMRPTGDDGWFGSGVYLTSHPGVADEIYSKQMTGFAQHRLIDDADLPVGESEIAHGYANEISRARVMMRGLRAELAHASDSLERADLTEQLAGLDEYIAARTSDLEKLGVRPESKVMPMFFRMTNGLDLTNATRYGVDSDLPLSFVQHMESEHLIDPAAAAEFLSAFETPEGLPGGEVWGHMQQWMQSALGYDSGTANNTITAFLRGEGYDGLKVEFENNLKEGRVAHTSYVAFETRNVKHIEADDFSASSDYLYGDQLAKVSPMPGLAAAAVDGNADLNTQLLGLVLHDMESNGGNPATSHALGTLARRRPLDGVTSKVLSALAHPANMIKDNASRARAWGDSFVSDWLKPKEGTGHFERQQRMMAERVMPLLDKLNALPGVGGAVKRWARDSVGRPQVPGMRKIVKALRRAPGSRAEQALTPTERAAYDSIRASFAEEIATMKREGMVIGEVRNGYFPQVWDADKITKNLPEFREKLSMYYLREAQANGKELTPTQAFKLADRVAHHIIDEEGTFFPTKGRTGGGEDHLDFQRLIRLDAEWAGESLDELEGFLQSDLQDVIVKYFDGSTRRTDFYRQFGHDNHAFHEYLQVIAGGVNEAAALLSTGKKVSKNLALPGSGGEGDRLAVDVPQIYAPFPNEAAAMDTVNEAKQLILAGRKEDARRLLLDVAQYSTPAYEKRVNAIVEAMAVTKGEKDVIKAADLEHLQGTMNAVQHKPIERGPFYDKMRTTSKVLRNFNAITMLSYTALTSIPDFVLPVLRSGRLGAAATAWAKMATNPDYRDAIRSTGVAIENLVHQRLTHMHGADSSKLSNAFFNAVGLTPWTNMQRKLSGAVAIEAFKAEQQIITKYAAKGMPLHSPNQPPKVKIAYRRLKQFGLEGYARPGSEEFISFDSAQALEDPKVREAMIRFADESIFSPNQVDIPLWAQTPWGSILFQLKSFPLMMMRLSGSIIKNAKEGDRQALYYLATLAPAFGALALNAKDVAQGRGGEDNREYAPRERSYAKWMEDFGIDHQLQGQTLGYDNDWLAGQYIEGFLHAGGFGLIADMLYQSAAQADNGAFGAQRWTSLFLGPSASLITDAQTIAGGVTNGLLKGGEDGTGKERAAARTLLRRIPLVGGNGAVREGLTDWAAGEPTKPGRKSGGGSDNGWGDGWGDGW